MKKIVILIFLLFSVLYASSDKNTTTVKSLDINYLGDLGGFLEPILAFNANNITQLIMMLGIIITVIISIGSVIIFFNTRSLKKQIEKNRSIIHDLEDKLKKNIKQEVKTQIVYAASDVLQNVEDDAYKKIDHAVVDIKSRVKSKLFDYQKFIFKVNQAKKYEYEEVINDAKISVEDKLQKMTIIQGRYNEINNNDIPKLFSDKVRIELIPVAIKLSKESELHDIIIDHLKHSIKENGYNYADSSRIKEIIKKYYHYDLDKSTK